MEEREICNVRITPNIPWNTLVYVRPAPQAGPSTCTTVAITSRFHSRPTTWDTAKPSLINTNLFNNYALDACGKKLAQNVSMYIMKCITLNDLNDYIEPSWNDIINSRQVPNRWEDRDKDFVIARWIDNGTEINEVYEASINVCAK